MKKILVTGSSGYIGNHLCPYLCKMGYHVTGLDRIEDGTGCHEFIHQNILDTKQIEGEYHSVIHLAALVQVSMGQDCMMEYYRNNVIGTMYLLERVKYNNFVFASTCQAEEPHVYGTSKRVAEITVRQFCGLNDIPHTIFRFGNVVGTAGYLPTNMDGLMYNLIKARETGVFNLYGDNYPTPDGTAQRDYIHVLDICHSIERAIVQPSFISGAEFKSFYEYLGHGKLYSVKECIAAFKEVNNCDFEVVMQPRRAGDPAKVDLKPVSPYMSINPYDLKQMMRVR